MMEDALVHTSWSVSVANGGCYHTTSQLHPFDQENDIVWADDSSIRQIVVAACLHVPTRAINEKFLIERCLGVPFQPVRSYGVAFDDYMDSHNCAVMDLLESKSVALTMYLESGTGLRDLGDPFVEQMFKLFVPTPAHYFGGMRGLLYYSKTGQGLITFNTRVAIGLQEKDQELLLDKIRDWWSCVCCWFGTDSRNTCTVGVLDGSNGCKPLKMFSPLDVDPSVVMKKTSIRPLGKNDVTEDVKHRLSDAFYWKEFGGFEVSDIGIRHNGGFVFGRDKDGKYAVQERSTVPGSPASYLVIQVTTHGTYALLNMEAFVKSHFFSSEVYCKAFALPDYTTSGEAGVKVFILRCSQAVSYK